MDMCNKYQPRKCWATGETESDVVCLGDCTRCSIGMTKENVPTFADIEQKYVEYAAASGGAIRPHTAKMRVCALRVVYRYSRIEPTDKVTALTEEVWDEIVTCARNDMSQSTIKGYGESIHSLLTDKSIRFFKQKYGWNCPKFPKLTAEAKQQPWISLSPEQRSKIRDYQFGLFNLSDPRKYLCITAAWERGQRKCDALRNHWSMFQERDGAIWWPYVSVKNGKPSNWPVDPDTWRMLTTAKERLLKMNVRHLGKYPDSYLRIREFSRDEHATSAIWDCCGQDLRDLLGWDGSKAMHNLRKDATDTIFQALGIDEAEEFSTDTAKTLRKHYIAKKRIMSDIPSIAKM